MEGEHSKASFLSLTKKETMIPCLFCLLTGIQLHSNVLKFDRTLCQYTQQHFLYGPRKYFRIGFMCLRKSGNENMHKVINEILEMSSENSELLDAIHVTIWRSRTLI